MESASFYPRTQVGRVNSIELYKDFIKQGLAPIQIGQKLLEHVAKEILKELEFLRELPSIIPKNLIQPVYCWLSRMPGFQSPKSAEKVMTALTQKVTKSLLS